MITIIDEQTAYYKGNTFNIKSSNLDNFIGYTFCMNGNWVANCFSPNMDEVILSWHKLCALYNSRFLGNETANDFVVDYMQQFYPEEFI